MRGTWACMRTSSRCLYPASAKQFIHSGLKGEWDRKKAGLRMKLEQPVTWERLLSQQGNKAATWEQLIAHGSSPPYDQDMVKPCTSVPSPHSMRPWNDLLPKQGLPSISVVGSLGSTTLEQALTPAQLIPCPSLIADGDTHLFSRMLRSKSEPRSNP
ncbi:unnamed protein product [Boreogadus saida]